MNWRKRGEAKNNEILFGKCKKNSFPLTQFHVLAISFYFLVALDQFAAICVHRTIQYNPDICQSDVTLQVTFLHISICHFISFDPIHFPLSGSGAFSAMCEGKNNRPGSKKLVMLTKLEYCTPSSLLDIFFLSSK